jgi:N-acetylglucosaminyldiphosphoundecaprenol N-acetyl-beta-D-mannosaminyltransferase
VLPSKKIIGISVNSLRFEDQINIIIKWSQSNLSKVVCIANVHMLVEGCQNPWFGEILHNADLVTPDGMPLVWMLRFLGTTHQDRVAGVDVLSSLCKHASERGVSIYFLGSQDTILAKMRERLTREVPNLDIAGMQSLPFRPLTPEEDRELISSLNRSGAGLILVSLGCPKQEIWMSHHKEKIAAVMIGLGGAFPVYAGIQKRAPKFFREAGLEWFFRLIQEPRRLWKRYASTIPVFIWLVIKQTLIEQTNLSSKFPISSKQDKISKKL